MPQKKKKHFFHPLDILYLGLAQVIRGSLGKEKEQPQPESRKSRLRRSSLTGVITF